MPITKYTGANIKKLKKDELISHVIELYGFIDLFNNEELKDKEIAKLKENYAQMKDWTDRHQKEIHRLKDEKNTLKEENDILNAYREEQTKIEKIIGDDDLIGRKVEDIVDIAPYIEKLKEENKKLKETNEIRFDKIKEMENEVGVSKLVHHQNLGLLEEITKFKKELKEEDGEKHEDDKELIKLKNDNEIVKMMFIDEFVRDEIEKTIDEGIDQYTFNIGTGYYEEHKLKYVKDIIMPHLTTYHNGDSQCSSYQNGKFYYKMDCMMPYDIETNNNGTYTFNRIDDDDE